MNKILVVLGTWIWQNLPSRLIRKKIWDCFLWWVRGKKKVETIDGVTFDLDLGEMIDVCIYVHRFEREVTGFIDATCMRGFVALDIGANIGVHCLRFARIVGDEGKVFAFEPTDYAYAKLQKNIALNRFGNIQTYHVALSNQNLNRQTISYRSSWRTDGSKSQETSVVDFVRLDDWATENAVDRLDIIKIDVDGNEFSILDGSRELLEKFKPMVIAEVGAWHFEDLQRNPWVILADMGYRFWDLQTQEGYSSLVEMSGKLPQVDTEMGFSMKVVAIIGNSPWGIKQ